MAQASQQEKKHHLVTRAGQVVESQMRTLMMIGIDSEMFRGATAEAIIANPNIVKCDEASFCRAVRDACLIGLVPNGKAAAIVPFKNGDKFDAVFMPMAPGLKSAVHDSTGGVVNSAVVRMQDHFEYEERPEGTHFRHRRCLMPVSGQPNDIYAAWATLRLPNGTILVRVVDKEELAAAQAASPSKKSGPWTNPQFYPAMCEKTAVHRLLRRNEYLLHANTKPNHGNRIEHLVDSDFQNPSDTDPLDVTDAGETVQDPPKAPRKNATPRKTAPAKQAAAQSQQDDDPPPPADNGAPDTGGGEPPLDFSQPIPMGDDDDFGDL